MDSNLKKKLFGMAAGALGISVIGCGGGDESASEAPMAAPAGAEATQGGEHQCGTNAAGEHACSPEQMQGGGSMEGTPAQDAGVGHGGHDSHQH